MELTVEATTKPLALSGTIVLDAVELTAASARSLDVAREQEIIDGLAVLDTVVQLQPTDNRLTFSLTESEILSVLAGVSQTDTKKLWLLVMLFLFGGTPGVNNADRTAAVIDFLTLVKEAKTSSPLV